VVGHSARFTSRRKVEPDAVVHVTGFAEGDVAFVLTRDGLEARRRAEVSGSKN
jgi:hypothetical protein